MYAMLCGRLCAYAAINANEAELLAIIDSQREYNGVLYQVSPDYRASARAYLDDPSVDVTAEQKQEAINQMFSSIQQGINDGYLIPVYQEAAAVDPAAAAGNLGSVIEGIESSAQLSAQDAAGQVQSAAAATAPETEPEITVAETTESQTEPAETEASETETEAASETETATETVAETVPVETEPSPIVLALEAAMSMDTHEVNEEPEYEELIPAYEYPEHVMLGAVGLGAFLCIAGIGISAGTGLFSHHHRRKRRADG